MSRRRSAVARKVLEDPKYGDRMVTRFINRMMVAGKKSVAEKIVYGALGEASEKLRKEPVELFHETIEQLTPLLEVRSRRVGGATYQVPVEVRPARKTTLAMRWLIGAARARKERTMRERLANEIMDALQKRGAAYRKREESHRMAEANKAFAHFRW